MRVLSRKEGFFITLLDGGIPHPFTSEETQVSSELTGWFLEDTRCWTVGARGRRAMRGSEVGADTAIE
jgi:hypothetical protein